MTGQVNIVTTEGSINTNIGNFDGYVAMKEAGFELFAYIGIASWCGCVLAIRVDRGGHDKETRRDVRELMKMGHVERVDLEVARKRLCTDRHHGYQAGTGVVIS